MSTTRSLTILSSLLALVSAQQVGTNTPETHPALKSQDCSAGACKNLDTTIVLDSNWRWLHSSNGSTANCYTGNTFNEELCPDGETCAANCAVDGAKYTETYGIKSAGSELTLKFVTQGESANVGSRVYLMEGAEEYKMFKLKNKEFTFDVDVSKLPCGLNGALYFSEMAADGGMSTAPTNKAGAKYGTGYCDAQCPHDIKFIDGKANSDGWSGSANDKNAGSGALGACCAEMDIWEANSMSTAFTPHPCSITGLKACTGSECGDDGADRYAGVCDKDGCDYNAFRMGNKEFYGAGMTVDTSKPFTVVTQFITSDKTDTGDLSEIRRVYVQDGKVIENPASAAAGVTGNSITDDFCAAQKKAFGDNNAFATAGGLKAMGESFERGMVLVMSLWDDHAANALWLDSQYPLDKDPTAPGVARGTCGRDTGKPEDVEANHPDATVTYSNIKFGAIGSTFDSAAAPAAPPAAAPPAGGKFLKA
ncbi:glycoside hydrolase family 7 protein [Aulographum hederae CBS 113979]|uniref:Glucanase n=1 Tax=Aulographum hederae CBS 113979 TaxID=1176131 RepID=A0A6G1H451_9PEZI|nr:glycoside hydrolase family 7 protein [Aulographum hederae CBS 113979]